MRENTDGCGALVTLRFSFTMNTDFTDHFADQVESVDLFVYGADKKLVTKQSYPRSEMHQGNGVHLRLPAGNYMVMVWGNFSESCYSVTEGETYETTRLSLLTTRAEVSTFTSLFHGRTNFTVVDDAPWTYWIDLTKNTSDVHVILENVPPSTYVAPGTDYMIRIFGSNTVYNFDNTLAASTPITYMPRYGSPDQNQVQADFMIQRLLTNSDVQVVVTNVNDPDNPLFNENLSALLMTRQTQLRTDEDFDRTDDYTLRFALQGSTLVLLSINDWDIVTPGPGTGI